MYCVINDLLIRKAHPDRCHQEIGIGIETNGFRAPLESSNRMLSQNVGDGWCRDDHSVVIPNDAAAGEPPAAIGGFNAVIDNEGPAACPLDEVRRRVAKPGHFAS